jgi:hypothetical protein
MACRVAIRRVVTTKRDIARLTGAQVDPTGSDLHTLFTFIPLWRFDRVDGSYMSAGRSSHNRYAIADFAFTAVIRASIQGMISVITGSQFS